MTAAFPARGKEIDKLRISDEMGGKFFVNWQPFDHPQLGRVEIGGFLNKILIPKYGTYTSVMCLPGERYDRLLQAHTKWHLYLMEQTPLIRVNDIQVEHLDGSLVRLEANIENIGPLPTYLTQQALAAKIAQPVKARIELSNATLVSGQDEVELGHLEGSTSRTGARARRVEWLVRLNGDSKATAVITARSQKGGTDTRRVDLR
jgi:hypothetical protein